MQTPYGAVVIERVGNSALDARIYALVNGGWMIEAISGVSNQTTRIVARCP